MQLKRPCQYGTLIDSKVWTHGAAVRQDDWI